MLSDAQIESLFRDSETDRVERKSAISSPDRIKEAICAFANDLPDYRKPGVIFIGQHDDKTCANLQIDEDLLELLGGWRSDGNMLPFPSMSVRRMTIDGCAVAVIVVEVSNNPPVRFRGRTWIRVGPRRAVATIAEENTLVERRHWKNLPFDARGVSGAELTDLDIKRFELEYLPSAFPKETLDQNGRTETEQLRALRLIDEQMRPTTTAILLLGLEPRTWFPGAYIQFLSVEGIDLTDPIRDQREISGVLADQLRILDELIDLSVTTSAIVGGTRRVEESTYPTIALKQLTRNAILHRSYQDTNAPTRVTWYSDRVEIISPGGPYGRVTQENFGRPGAADYRNPTLAEALKSLGYVDRFGLGLQIVRDSLGKNGNPQAEFIVESNFVHVTVRKN